MAVDSLSLLRDPYFLATQQNGLSTQQYQNAIQNVGQTPPASTNTPVFEGNVPRAKKVEEKDNSTAKLVLGTVALVGATVLLKKAHKAGNGNNIFEKIYDGFKGWYKVAKSKFTGSSNKLRVTNDGKVVIIPNKVNRIDAKALDEIEKIGGKIDLNPQLSDKNIRYISYNLKLSDGSIAHVRGGNVNSITNAKGNKAKLTTKRKDEAEKLMAAVTNRKPEALEKLRNVYFTQTVDDITYRYVAESADKIKLKGAITHKFPSDSGKLETYFFERPEIKNALDAFKEGKTDSWKKVLEEYKIDDGSIIIKGDNIIGFRPNNSAEIIPKGTPAFSTCYWKNEELFNKVFDNRKNFQTLEYQVA